MLLYELDFLSSHWDFPFLDAAAFMRVLRGLLSEYFCHQSVLSEHSGPAQGPLSVGI